MTLNKRDVKKMIKDAASNIKYLLQNVIIMQTFLQQQKKKKIQNIIILNRIILKKYIFKIV